MNTNNSTICIGISHFNGITSGIWNILVFHLSSIVLRSAVVYSMRTKSFGLPYVE
jgi:hypothetical protein